MSKSIKVASKDFPKSVLELQNLYELKTNFYSNNSRDNYKFHTFIENGEKLDISDLNISIFKENSFKNKLIEIFVEKLEINIDFYKSKEIEPNKNMMDSIIIAEKELYKYDFNKLFQCISKDILAKLKSKTLINQLDIDVIINSYLNEDNNDQLKNFSLILSILLNKIDKIIKEREITALITADNESTMIKNLNENKLLKKDLEQLTTDYINLKQNNQILYVEISNLREQNKVNSLIIESLKNDIIALKQGNFMYDKHIYSKFSEINKFCNEIQLGLNEKKVLIENENLIKFIESNQFQTNINDINGTIRLITDYLRKLCFIPLLVFDSTNLNNLYRFLNKTMKKTIFCSLCNEFKNQTNLENKLCERHLICDSCSVNYSKKIRCLKDKQCFCKTYAN